MAAKGPSTPQDDDSGSKIDFAQILAEEINAINERRAASRPNSKQLEIKPLDAYRHRVIDAVGLALSGGGIRSAAVSLGVLQALDHHSKLGKIDYLSTVSGGGYMGSSLTATMTRSGGRFVFAHPRAGTAGQTHTSEISDTDAVGHLRNYSNYLIPRGARDLLTGITIVTRGLVANLGLLLPVVLLLAAVTVWSTPLRTNLREPNLFGLPLVDYLQIKHFGITLCLALFGVALFFAWALYRSFASPQNLSEFRTWLPTVASIYLLLAVGSFFCELQPFIIDGMFEIADQQAGVGQGALLGLVTSWVKTLAAVTAPLATVVIFFRQQFGDLLKAATTTATLTTRILAVAAKGVVWVAGAALPLVIWVLYLYLCYWGIINDKVVSLRPDACKPGTLSGTLTIESPALKYSGKIDGNLGNRVCEAGQTGDQAKARDGGEHTPRWLLIPAGKLADIVPAWLDRLVHHRFTEHPMIWLYIIAGVGLFLLSWPLKPNANSLHRIYRDRLSKAFLFDPKVSQVSRANPDAVPEFAPLDSMPLTELSTTLAPYHLINAALNIQGSTYANRRGRNADFFLFSPAYIGSAATGYAKTEQLQRRCPDLDLATAMAISGAAASSNMGHNSIRPLTPTLALLNVRLGYWLRNPRFLSSAAPRAASATRRAWVPKHRSSLFLWREITGRLYEDADEVYLTDGGHIENLGVYELLRRRCRVILAVDAEADVAMHFPSLITLQRYARIDLGIRIDLPWEPIQKRTLAFMGGAAAEPKTASSSPQTPPAQTSSAPTQPGPAPSPQTPQPQQPPIGGPHVAVGVIDYGAGEIGYLVYVKSSLSGDENDYIRDYQRRNTSFPQETTGDQFFSEEQFEVYRALGFHMVHGLLSGEDDVPVRWPAERGDTQTATMKFTASNPALDAVRAALT